MLSEPILGEKQFWTFPRLSLDLGIDEKDLMIAAIAIQHEFRLATVDRNHRMIAIENAAKSLVAQGHKTKLEVDHWTL